MRIIAVSFKKKQAKLHLLENYQARTPSLREHVTVFRKTNRSARKSIITYEWKYVFEHEDANVNKEKEARFIRRRSVGLPSNLDGGIFAQRNR